jgi:CheY-like chemotaxis protein
MTLEILLVEDDEKIRDLLGRFLKAGGHHVRPVKDGQEALDAIPGNNFNIILMDIRMPRLDGLSALSEIRKTSQTPVVLITGYQINEGIEKALQDKTVACLRKPFTFNDLNTLIARMVNGKNEGPGESNE